MRNPFAMMALMAAAMSDAFRENAYRDAGMALPKARARSRIPGPKMPAGAKLIMRFYKAKHGVKADDYETAREWYAGYLAEQDAKVRAAEAAKKAARAARAAPWRVAA